MPRNFGYPISTGKIDRRTPDPGPKDGTSSYFAEKDESLHPKSQKYRTALQPYSAACSFSMHAQLPANARCTLLLLARTTHNASSKRASHTSLGSLPVHRPCCRARTTPHHERCGPPWRRARGGSALIEVRPPNSRVKIRAGEGWPLPRRAGESVLVGGVYAAHARSVGSTGRGTVAVGSPAPLSPFPAPCLAVAQPSEGHHAGRVSQRAEQK
jgi:hypothetical protein